MLNKYLNKWNQDLAAEPAISGKCITGIKTFLNNVGDRKKEYSLYLFNAVVELLKKPIPSHDILVAFLHYLYNLDADNHQIYLKYLCNYSIYLHKKKEYNKFDDVIPFLEYVSSEDKEENIDLFCKITQNILSVFHSDRELQSNKHHIECLGNSYVNIFNAYNSVDKKFSIFDKMFEMKLLHVFLSIDVEIATRIWANLIGGLTHIQEFETEAAIDSFFKKIISHINCLLQLSAIYKDCCYQYVISLLTVLKKSKLLPRDNILYCKLTDIIMIFVTLLTSSKIELFADFLKEIESLALQNDQICRSNAVETAIIIIRYIPKIEEVYKNNEKFISPNNIMQIFKTITYLIKFMYHVDSTIDRGFCNKCTNTKRHAIINSINFIIKLYEMLSSINKCNKTVTGYVLEKIKYVFVILDGLNCDKKLDLIKNCCIKIYNIVRVFVINSPDTLCLMHSELILLVNQYRHTYNITEINDLQIIKLLQILYATNVKAIDLACIKILTLLRTGAPRRDVRAETYSFKTLQRKHGQSLSLLATIEKTNLSTFKFVVDRYDKADLIVLEMETIFHHSKEKFQGNDKLFTLLMEHADDNILSLGYALIYLNETDYYNLDAKYLENLMQRINNQITSNNSEQFQKALILGQMYYRKYFQMVQLTKDLTKETTIALSTESIKKNDIGAILDAVQVDKEIKLIEILDNSLKNYKILVEMLLENDFNEKYKKDMISMIKVIKNLENIMQQYCLRLFENKAIETNSLIYILSKHRKNDTTTMSSLAYVIDNPNHFKISEILNPNYFSNSIDEIILDLSAFIDVEEKNLVKCSNFQRFNLIRCILSLSKYYIAVNDSAKALEHLNRADQLIVNISEMNSDTIASTYVRIMRAMYCFVNYLFSNSFVECAKPKTFYIRQVLREISEIKDIPNEVTTQLIMIITQSVMHLLNLILSCYDVHGIHIYSCMIMKMALKNNLGTLSAYIFANSIMIDLNLEKLDEARMKLNQLETLLSLRKTGASRGLKSVKQTVLAKKDVPVSTLFDEMEPFGEIRKSAIDKSPMRKFNLIYSNPDEIDKLPDFHADDCICIYCSIPQLKFLIFQYYCLTARLLYMEQDYNSCDEFYKYFQPYALRMCDRFNADGYIDTIKFNYTILRNEFNVFLIRVYLQYSHMYVRQNKTLEAAKICELAVKMIEKNPMIHSSLVQDIYCHLSNIEILREFMDLKEKNERQSIMPMSLEYFYNNLMKPEERTPQVRKRIMRAPQTVAALPKITKHFCVEDTSEMTYPVVMAVTEKKKRNIQVFSDSPQSKNNTNPLNELHKNKFGARKKLLIDNLNSNSPAVFAPTPKKTTNNENVAPTPRAPPSRSSNKRLVSNVLSAKMITLPSTLVEKEAKKLPGRTPRKKKNDDVDVFNTAIICDEQSFSATEKNSTTAETPSVDIHNTTNSSSTTDPLLYKANMEETDSKLPEDNNKIADKFKSDMIVAISSTNTSKSSSSKITKKVSVDTTAAPNSPSTTRSVKKSGEQLSTPKHSSPAVKKSIQPERPATPSSVNTKTTLLKSNSAIKDHATKERPSPSSVKRITTRRIKTNPTNSNFPTEENKSINRVETSKISAKRVVKTTSNKKTVKKASAKDHQTDTISIVKDSGTKVQSILASTNSISFDSPVTVSETPLQQDIIELSDDSINASVDIIDSSIPEFIISKVSKVKQSAEIVKSNIQTGRSLDSNNNSIAKKPSKKSVVVTAPEPVKTRALRNKK